MLPVKRWLCCQWRRGYAAGGDAAVLPVKIVAVLPVETWLCCLPVGGGLWSDTVVQLCCRWRGGYAAGGDAAVLPVGNGCVGDTV
jgi:hypothetical protein